MDSPTASPPVPTASSTPTADLKSPLSSLEIAIGRGTTLAQVVGAVVGLAALAAFLYGLLYLWRAFINSKYAGVANAGQQLPINLYALPPPSSRQDT